MTRVAVITDSSARLSPATCRRWGIDVVPLHLLVAGGDLRDGVDEIAPDIHDLANVSTAGATPEEFGAVFRRALDRGADGIVATPISSALSSTHSAALSAARQLGSAVRVVDSRSAAMGTGFVALAAARAAAGGASLDAVERAAVAAVHRTSAFIVVHRLDNLRRSGRIGTTASWLGTALSLKPLLRVDPEGRLVLDQRIRTAARARAVLVDRVVELVGPRQARMVVHHVANPEAAAAVADALADRLPAVGGPGIVAMGPVLGVHVGAGATGVCVEVDPSG